MYTIQAVAICYNCNEKYHPSLEGQLTDGSTICPFCSSINYATMQEVEYLKITSVWNIVNFVVVHT